MRSLLRINLINFANIGPHLANKIPQGDLTFKPYLPTVNTTLNEAVFSGDEFKVAFKSLRRIKLLAMMV